MAYTNIWDDTKPTGSEPANTIDDLMRSGKVDIEQRFNDMFAMPSFATDPLRLYGLKFTDAQDSVINLGDNGGTPRSLAVKNKAGSTTFLSLNTLTGLSISASTLTLALSSTVTNDLYITLIGLASVKNWRIGRNITLSNAFEIQVSASNGGTDYGTIFTLTNTGALTLVAGPTVTQDSTINNVFTTFTNSEAVNGKFWRFQIIGGGVGQSLVLNTNNTIGNAIVIAGNTGLVTFAGGLTLSSGKLVISGDLDLPGAGLGITNGTTRFLAVASGTNPALHFATTGGYTFDSIITVSAGGLTVSAGTTALQALTCTTLGVSGQITSTSSGLLFTRSGATTVIQYIDIGNTTGRFFLGIDSSVGAGLMTGSLPYSTCLTTVGSTVLHFATNQVLAITISTAQLVTIASGLVITTGGLTVSAGGITANILGVGHAPVATFAISAQGTTNDSTTSVFQGINLAGTSTSLINSDGSAFFSANVQCNNGLAINTGTVSVLSGFLFLNGATTAHSSLRVQTSGGVAPTSPTDGDMWYDGTNVKFRVGAVTKTFTLT